MSIEPLRVITDRWEWDAIAKLVPTVYHEQAWTVASVTRIRSQTSVPVSYGYARVWVGETLVGCPLIRLGSRWFNSPRARPLVVKGCALNAAGALKRACARPTDSVAARLRLRSLQLYEDDELIAGIERTRLRLDTRTASRRIYRSMSLVELREMTYSLLWDDMGDARAWTDAVRACWRAGNWMTTVAAHRDKAEATIGYTVWVHRGTTSECVAAAEVGEYALVWTVDR